MLGWTALTQPQATVIAGALTCLAAIGGVLLAWKLFSSKVRDLKGALQESESLLLAHRDTMTVTLTAIYDRVLVLDEQSRSASESLGKIQGRVEDIDESARATADIPEGQENIRQRMRDRWADIRDRLEAVAASKDIDGRTRAKYARIDRRNYMVLVDAMAWDGALGDNGEIFLQAVEVWHRYRSGRSTPTIEDDTKMERLHGLIMTSIGREAAPVE